MTQTPLEAGPRVLSRHGAGDRHGWTIQVENANAWCRLPGSPFAGGLSLRPNHPSRAPVSVTYGPFDLPDWADTFTVLLTTSARAAHQNTIEVVVELLGQSGAPAAEATVRLGHAAKVAATLRVRDGSRTGVRLRFTAGFASFDEHRVYGIVQVDYLLAYEHNVLVELMNHAGSDKGTEVAVGRGVPHCYALEYHRLFNPFRNERFSLLEIGLANSSPPVDAPSLTAWRSYFPNATLYGYDSEDFGFFVQQDTHAFRGDQASRDDLRRFLTTHEMPGFRVIIDDGSHASSHQQISLATLFPYVSPAGLYIIEDLNWQPFSEKPTTLAVLDAFVEHAAIQTPFMTEAEARYLEETIASVDIYRPNDSDVAVIEKRAD